MASSWIYLVLLVLAFLPLAGSECQFPQEMRGAWHSSAFGDVTVNETNILPITVQGRTLSYECLISENGKVIIRSDSFTFASLDFVYYTCLSFYKLNDDKYLVHNLTAANSEVNNEHLKAEKLNYNATIDNICTMHSKPEEFSFLLRKGAATRSSVMCPNSLLARMEVTFKDSFDHTRCPQGGRLDVCTNNHLLAFNYSQCSMGSQNYTCLYTTRRGRDDIVVLHNDNDQKVHNPYAPLSCLMASGNETLVYATHSTGDCMPSQTAQTVSTGNPAMELKAIETCHVAPKNLPSTTPPEIEVPINKGLRTLQTHAALGLAVSLLVGAFLLGISG